MEEFLASSIRMATPLLFAAMGGLLCERVGIATICLEGVMLISAFVAASVTFAFQNPWAGVFAGMLAGSLMMGLHGLLVLKGRADQIVSGVAINLLATGLCCVLCKVFFGAVTSTATLDPSLTFHGLDIPLLSKIPLLGPVLFQQPWLIYLSFLLPFLLYWIFTQTGLGLRLMACGDSPESLRSVGVSPLKIRTLTLLVGGMIASFGGIYMSISHGSQFTRDMTAGRGYIALAAVIFGKWKPLPAALTCLFFGLTDAMSIQLQGTMIFGVQLPVQAIQALPYVMTLAVLAGFIGKPEVPLTIGKSLD